MSGSGSTEPDYVRAIQAQLDLVTQSQFESIASRERGRSQSASGRSSAVQSQERGRSGSRNRPQAQTEGSASESSSMAVSRAPSLTRQRWYPLSPEDKRKNLEYVNAKQAEIDDPTKTAAQPKGQWKSRHDNGMIYYVDLGPHAPYILRRRNHVYQITVQTFIDREQLPENGQFVTDYTTRKVTYVVPTNPEQPSFEAQVLALDLMRRLQHDRYREQYDGETNIMQERNDVYYAQCKNCGDRAPWIIQGNMRLMIRVESSSIARRSRQG